MSDAGPHEFLNALSEAAAAQALEVCCGSRRWVAGMLERRPFASEAALRDAANTVWAGLEPSDVLEAFAHHPRIGEDLAKLREKFARTAHLASGEQASVSEADSSTLEALRDANRAYEARFGFIFIVCATGKSAREMLDLLNQRLANDPELELRVAASEQARITQLRLSKLRP